ncbi:MAG: TolC family protein [Opitutales bacterium]|nr:TolC family protein [Opitutales bacterium]MDG1325613.1 TolC family protein [Opitutales bacterium]
MKLHTICLLIPLFSFLSCKSTKTRISEPEEVLIPAQWNSEFKITTTDSNVTYWTDSFRITPLTRLISKANHNNPELASMYERMVAKGEDATILGANLLPTANASIAATRNKRNLIGFNFPNSETSFTSNSFNSGINLSWEIDLWGKIKDSRNSAKKRFESSLSDYQAARLSLNGQVAKAWFNLVENSFQLKLVKKTIETYSKNLSFINDRYQKGLATALEQKLAEASYLSSQANLAQRERVGMNLTQSLQELIGEYPDGKLDLNSSMSLPDLVLPPLPPTPAKVVESRHDLNSARLKVQSTGLDLKVANKNLLPSFTLTGGPGSRSDSFNDLVDQRFRVWDISGAVSQPIFQGGRLRAGIRKSEALQNSALLDLKAVILRAFVEVENALSAEIHLANEETNLQRSSIAFANAAELSWRRYQRGVEGIFNALDTQRRSFEAESRYLQLKKERILNRINLYLAIGMEAIATEL